MRYWAKVDSRSVVDIISLYGYGLVVWIPVAVRQSLSLSPVLSDMSLQFLTIPPIAVMRLVFTALAYALSGYFLLKKFVASPIHNSPNSS